MVSLGPARTPVPSLCTQTAAEGARNTETRSLHLASPTEWRLREEALEEVSELSPCSGPAPKVLSCWDVAQLLDRNVAYYA